MYWLKTASRLRSFQKVNVCICWSQTTPIYGFSFFRATGRAACQDETTISVARPEDYPFLESLLENKQHFCSF